LRLDTTGGKLKQVGDVSEQVNRSMRHGWSGRVFDLGDATLTNDVESARLPHDHRQEPPEVSAAASQATENLELDPNRIGETIRNP
jgi:hypothetical protein